MPKVMTSKCKYCGHTFRNPTKAQVHELEEMIIHNPEPIYFMCVEISLDSDNRNVVGFNIHRKRTYIEDGKQYEFEKYYDNDNPKSSCHPFTEPLDEWKMWDSIKDPKIVPAGKLGSVLPKGLENNRNKGNVTLEIVFKGWDSLLNHIQEVRASLPDAKWLGTYSQYLSDAKASIVSTYIDSTSNAVKLFLRENTDWADRKNRHADRDGDNQFYKKTGMGRFNSYKYGINPSEQSKPLEISFYDTSEDKEDGKDAPKSKKVLDTEVKYVCGCGRKFDTEEEYKAHLADNSIVVYVLTMEKDDNYFDDDICPSPAALDIQKTRMSRCIGKKSWNRKGDWAFDKYDILRGLTAHDIFSKVFMKKWNKEINDYEYVPLEDGSAFSKADDIESHTIYGFFRDPSDLAFKYEQMQNNGFHHYLLSKIERYFKQRGNCLKALKQSIDGGFELLISELRRDSDGIKGCIDGLNELGLFMRGDCIYTVVTDSDKDEECRAMTLYVGKENKRSIYDLLLGDEEKRKKEARKERDKARRSEYKNTDKFIMSTAIDFGNDCVFISKEIIDGAQRFELEEKASQDGMVCSLSSGSLSVDYKDIIKSFDMKFQKITDAEADTLKKVGMDKVVNISYDDIMDGLHEENEEDSE